MSIGRRDVDQDDVERDGAAQEESRHVRQEDRHVVGTTLVDRGPCIGPDEERPMPEMAGHLGSQVRTRPLRVEVDDRDVAQLLRPIDEGVEEDRRRGRGAMDIDPVARSNDAGRLGRRDHSHRPSLPLRASRTRHEPAPTERGPLTGR